ncbi:hypothetical protein [Nitriliruptor alkaliphilus]|uniref:hypothetical protein n=1 Tax=Nitriliruptor alkaliphilus TaxID=427918 RepID=UPI0006989328|nr:hypothetical protein [Nitriliruptor alkaliphilus]
MIDTTSLFLHVLAAIGMVGGGIVQVLAGVRVRGATTGRDLASWARFTRSAGVLIAFSALLSLMTGGHLAGAVWGGDAGGFSNPFITLGVVGLLLLAPVGPMIGGARLRRLAEAGDEAGDAPVTTELRSQAASPMLWGPVHSLVGVGVGLVALMVYKPSWGAGTALLVLTFAAGWLAGTVLAASAGRPQQVVSG